VKRLYNIDDQQYLKNTSQINLHSTPTDEENEYEHLKMLEEKQEEKLLNMDDEEV